MFWFHSEISMIQLIQRSHVWCLFFFSFLFCRMDRDAAWYSCGWDASRPRGPRKNKETLQKEENQTGGGISYLSAGVSLLTLHWMWDMTSNNLNKHNGDITEHIWFIVFKMNLIQNLLHTYWQVDLIAVNPADIPNIHAVLCFFQRWVHYLFNLLKPIISSAKVFYCIIMQCWRSHTQTVWSCHAISS